MIEKLPGIITSDILKITAQRKKQESDEAGLCINDNIDVNFFRPDSAKEEAEKESKDIGFLKCEKKELPAQAKAEEKQEPVKSNLSQNMKPGDGNKFTGAGMRSILMEEQNGDILKNKKRELIDAIIDGSVSAKDKERIYERLEKFPESALELINKDNTKILVEKINENRVSGKYNPNNNKIMIEPKVLNDLYVNHPLLSTAVASKNSLLKLAAIGQGAAAVPAAVISFPVGIALLFTANLTWLADIQLKGNALPSVHNTAEHETGHSLDHAIGNSKNWKNAPVYSKVTENATEEEKTEFERYNREYGYFSYKSKEVCDNYLSCKNKENNSGFITDYASTSPVEYFAESVMAYLNTKQSGSLVHRQDLLQKDPKMYKFIEKLFRDIESGAFD